MNDADSVVLSVRAEARQLVAPDYAVLDGLIEHTAGSKAEAVGAVTANLDRLTADLAAHGAVPFGEATARRPLTWSAYSSTTREESYHDKETGRLETPALNPVPQELTAAIEARFRTTGVSLPGT